MAIAIKVDVSTVEPRHPVFGQLRVPFSGGPGPGTAHRLFRLAYGLPECGPDPKAFPIRPVAGNAVVPTIGFVPRPSAPAPRKCYRCHRSLAAIDSSAAAAAGIAPVARVRPPVRRPQ